MNRDKGKEDLANKKCAGCQTGIKGRQYLRCSICSQYYDLECANVSEQRFRNTLTAEHRVAWKCPLCKNKEPKHDNSNTPIRSVKVDDTKEEDGASRNPRIPKDRTPIEPIITEKISDTTNLGEIMTHVKNILEELRAVRSEMHEFRTLITNNKERIDSLSLRMEVLEQRQSHTESTESHLQETILELQQNLNDREQELLSNDLEIAGIPEEKAESGLHIVLSLCTKMGVTMDNRDVVSVERVGPVRASVQDAQTARPRALVVRLARRALRDEILAAARVRRSLNTEGMGGGTPKPFYINERLTKQNRQVFFKAREAASKAKWRYVWTRDGKIFARHEAGSSRHRLKSEGDIRRVFGINIS